MTAYWPLVAIWRPVFMANLDLAPSLGLSHGSQRCENGSVTAAPVHGAQPVANVDNAPPRADNCPPQLHPRPGAVLGDKLHSGSFTGGADRSVAPWCYDRHSAPTRLCSHAFTP